MQFITFVYNKINGMENHTALVLNKTYLADAGHC